MHPKTEEILEFMMKPVEEAGKGPGVAFLWRDESDGEFAPTVAGVVSGEWMKHLARYRAMIDEAAGSLPENEAEFLASLPVGGHQTVLAYEQGESADVWENFFKENGAEKCGQAYYLPVTSEFFEKMWQDVVEQDECVEDEICKAGPTRLVPGLDGVVFIEAAASCDSDWNMRGVHAVVEEGPMREALAKAEAAAGQAPGAA